MLPVAVHVACSHPSCPQLFLVSLATPCACSLSLNPISHRSSHLSSLISCLVSSVISSNLSCHLSSHLSSPPISSPISSHMFSCYSNYMPSLCDVELQLEWLQWLRSDCWCINLRQSACACMPGNHQRFHGAENRPSS